VNEDAASVDTKRANQFSETHQDGQPTNQKKNVPLVWKPTNEAHVEVTEDEAFPIPPP